LRTSTMLSDVTVMMVGNVEKHDGMEVDFSGTGAFGACSQKQLRVAVAQWRALHSWTCSGSISSRRHIDKASDCSQCFAKLTQESELHEIRMLDGTLNFQKKN
jgi:hypothetical protein